MSEFDPNSPTQQPLQGVLGAHSGLQLAQAGATPAWRRQIDQLLGLGKILPPTLLAAGAEGPGGAARTCAAATEGGSCR